MTIFHILKFGPVEDIMWKDLPDSVKVEFQAWVDTHKGIVDIKLATAKLTELIMEYDGEEL